ncbi:unnamed protein product [Rhodiola kirilowii]
MRSGCLFGAVSFEPESVATACYISLVFRRSESIVEEFY